MPRLLKTKINFTLYMYEGSNVPEEIWVGPVSDREVAEDLAHGMIDKLFVGEYVLHSNGVLPNDVYTFHPVRKQ